MLNFTNILFFNFLQH